jgi:glycine/D-amino acid oxidase-like deaminating enzyme
MISVGRKLTLVEYPSAIDWILSNAIKRLPILGESEYETLITGADSFTPDGRLIMNESAEVSNTCVLSDRL